MVFLYSNLYSNNATEHDNIPLDDTDAAHLIDINNCENCLTIRERENRKLLFVNHMSVNYTKRKKNEIN